MKSATQKASVGPWDHVSKLSISFDDGTNSDSGRIYRNGIHQIAVRVTVEARDADEDILTEENSPGIREQVLSQLSLINSSGLAGLPFVAQLDNIGGCGGNSWCYARQRNDFDLGGISRADSDDGRLQFVFYVMCPPAEGRSSISILAKVVTPSGPIDTSGGANNMPLQSVHITAMQPVRYTEANTSLGSEVAFRAPENGGNLTKLARNYRFSCNEQGYRFVRFELGRGLTSGHEYFHVFDDASAYHNTGDSFSRYRKFRLAYAWSKSDAPDQAVFGLRTAQNAQPEPWPVRVNQDASAQYFTVVEYDSTVGGGPGFGYPGSPVNSDANPPIGGIPLSFTTWDQYGNSGEFYPTTDGLLDEFKVLPGSGGALIKQAHFGAQRAAERSTWDNVAGIKKLDIEFGDSPAARVGDIYSNGHNQICVIVRVQAQDIQNHPVLNPSSALQDAIFSNLYLVSRNNMAPLVWQSNSGWNYTNQRNAFVTSPSTGGFIAQSFGALPYTVGDDGTITYTFYVMCAFSQTDLSVGLAAQVRAVPDGYGGTKNYDCAGNTTGIPQSVLTLRAQQPHDFASQDLRTTPLRVIDNHRPPGRDAHDYLDTHTWVMPSGMLLYSWEWAQGSNDYNCTASAYYRAGQDKDWLIYGSVYLPAKNNGTLQRGTYNRRMGDCLHYNYGGFNGSDYNSFVDFQIVVEPNQIVVNKVIGTGFSYINEDWNFPNQPVYIDVIDTVGTRRRLRFDLITTTDYGTGPQVTSQVIGEW